VAFKIPYVYDLQNYAGCKKSHKTTKMFTKSIRGLNLAVRHTTVQVSKLSL